MDTTRDTEITWEDRLPAQASAFIGALCALVSFFLGDELALFAFLLAAVGVLAVVAMILRLPADGWLAAEEAR
ncbi:hypothetical protein [Brachybacterium kimchii]|uniref:Uncharacterized protein n=1 Tax=Brachybacterium kimchii TaxID=2942909 RepID=A0ABY4N7G7_9MICO|nr:hypothetical protein [Brachybacterium kimchii]UQN30494.1 hypothetical protein M4486_03890 [Brachybacterium kimchii]